MGMPGVIETDAPLPRTFHRGLPAASDPLGELMVAVRRGKDELLTRVLLARRQDLIDLALSMLLQQGYMILRDRDGSLRPLRLRRFEGVDALFDGLSDGPLYPQAVSV